LGIGMQAEMRYSKQLWPLWVLSSCCSLSRRDLICHRDQYLKRLSVIRRNYILAPWKRKRRLLSRDLLPTCHLNTGRKESVQVCNEKSNADIPETIFALSTPPGRAALAVIRVSGTQSLPLLRRLSKSNETIDFSPRKLIRRRIVDPCTGAHLDDAMVTYFRSPKSYTGEDMLELYLHGSPAVVSSVFKALEDSKLARLAQPGEFTRRAFENGKMDLVKVEALADLIHSETPLQVQQALKNLDGALSKRLYAWREKLMTALAHLEALLDYGEEAEIPDNIFERAFSSCEQMKAEIRQVVEGKSIGEMVRDGIQVAIIGSPNAGKSSLLNTLAGRDVAIVTSIPGTTRDIVQVPLQLNGVKVCKNRLLVVFLRQDEYFR